jgi:AhpD family alkylhydroperoxidase
MEERFSISKAAPGVYHAMLGLETYLKGCGLEEPLLHLIRLRASQVNGCAYCIDMHWKDLAAAGEKAQRMFYKGRSQGKTPLRGLEVFLLLSPHE